MTRSWPALESRICLAAEQHGGYEQALHLQVFFVLQAPAGPGQQSVNMTEIGSTASVKRIGGLARSPASLATRKTVS
jgi:hypothetical protein